MYIPASNQINNKPEMVSFMQRFNFATVVTSENNMPVATHLPFIVEEKEGEVILSSHFARANDQWKSVEKCSVLVIFSEPHAYISPSSYEKELNVPTWNYVSVHAYGRAVIIHEKEEIMNLLIKTMEFHEPEYLKQWKNLPDSYIEGLVKGIVAFSIKVTDLQGKKKLSQNKTITEQQNIIDSLSASESSNETAIADYMRKELTHIIHDKSVG